ncbi:Type II toxin-antitoxin system Phd/YefM family antitoxin [Candidatus Bealeia paramacronuclearis]|uniref:Antitoxin n=1 Tax=Candidatus Bealeia paramacronuclearis TaxID=1921001 RepID=A0ABZ2C3N6_9PROT|nr:Type II toxin-antitoxin system Phd/YefM family antitoxin [Candidatus Bealeia paramacronuclearis]
MEIYQASKARENLYKLIDFVATSHEPVYILGKRNKAVMIAEEDYRTLIEALHIVSVPGIRDSILEARNTPLQHYREELEWE